MAADAKVDLGQEAGGNTTSDFDMQLQVRPAPASDDAPGNSSRTFRDNSSLLIL